MPQLSEAPFLNLFDPAIREDPDPPFAALRAESAVVQTPLGAGVIRRDAAHQVLTDARVVSALPFLARAQGAAGAQLDELLSSAILALDGEDHARVRRLVSRSFTPKAADRHRDSMRELADSLIDGFARDGECEFVTAFADQYPIQVMCEVLGVPTARHADFARWGDSLTHVLGLELMMHRDEVEVALAELGDYLEVLIAERRAAPGDDLVSSLVQANEDGDRLSDLELRALIGGLLFAGYDTTRNQLSSGMFLFAHEPEQWQLLRQRPELAMHAVNEIMRIASVVNATARLATEELEIDGWTIPKGTIVMVSLFSANRDEDLFSDALRFDITREGPPHLTFGAGPHFCLGANLARAEMEEALRLLSLRLPEVHLDGDAIWREGTGITGLTRLPLTFGL